MSGRIWPGALCWITNSRAGNNGMVVTCVKRVPLKSFTEPDGRVTREPAWVIDRPLRCWDGRIWNVCPENQLTPITPPPGTEETSDTAPSEIEPAHPGWG